MPEDLDRSDPGKGLQAGWLGREPPAFRLSLEGLTKLKRIPAGQSLYASEDHADALVGLASGHLALLFPLVSGEETVSHICSPGFWLGATMLATREPRRHLTAVARTEVTIAVAPLTAVRRMLQEEPEGWAAIARLMEVHWALTACIARDLMLRAAIETASWRRCCACAASAPLRHARHRSCAFP